MSRLRAFLQYLGVESLLQKSTVKRSQLEDLQTDMLINTSDLVAHT
jgi:hypothetical protein